MSTIRVLVTCLLCVVWGIGCSVDPPQEGRSAGDCGDGADNDGDGRFDCDDEGCLGSPVCGSSDRRDGGTIGPAVDSSPGGDGSVDERGPIFLSLSANVATLTDDEALIISAVLTDPDGIDDLIGGTLQTPDGASYGAFSTSSSEGSYQMMLVWGDINRVSALDFEERSEARSFVAEFFDVAGHRARRTIEVGFECQDAADLACGGPRCDPSTDIETCGSCGNDCRAMASRVASASAAAQIFPGAASIWCEGSSACGVRLSVDAGVSCNEACGSEAGCISSDFGDCAEVRSYGQSCWCTQRVACTAGAESTPEMCRDGCSNDGDAYVDCGDRDCCGVVDCPAGTYCGDR